jgi:hypothetical protein
MAGDLSEKAAPKNQDILQILDCRRKIERVLKVQSKILNLKSEIRLRVRWRLAEFE